VKAEGNAVFEVSCGTGGLGAGVGSGDREAVWDALHRKEISDVLCSQESLKRHGWRARRRRLAARFQAKFMLRRP
jgi:hypothetical protein